MNICNEFPDIYIMIAVIGSCLTGARATSHAFLSLRVSISSVVGGARTVGLDTAFWEEDCMVFLCPCCTGRALLVEVKPGGSGIPLDFFAGGGELRSRTHCGGGGAAMIE